LKIQTPYKEQESVCVSFASRCFVLWLLSVAAVCNVDHQKVVRQLKVVRVYLFFRVGSVFDSIHTCVKLMDISYRTFWYSSTCLSLNLT
jgi:hypothetical protein